MKIVINRCYGGFGISDKAMLRYAEIKGITVYPETNATAFGGTTFWTVPLDQKPKEHTSAEWQKMSLNERQEFNKKYTASYINDRDIPRNDPALVQVVEELGNEANDNYASLAIVDIPDDIKWQIEEYDGYEHVAEQHRVF